MHLSIRFGNFRSSSFNALYFVARTVERLIPVIARKYEYMIPVSRMRCVRDESTVADPSNTYDELGKCGS